MRDDVSVLLLGPVRLTTPSGEVAIPGGDQRTALARLAATPGEPVPIHDLIEAVWGASFPVTAVQTLHCRLARFRLELRAAGLDDLIEASDAGYRLRVPPGCVDAVRFESLARQGRRHIAAGDVPRAERVLAQAVSLWRDTPLGDCEQTAWVRREAARLTGVLRTVHVPRHAPNTVKSLVSRDKDVEEVTWLLANDRLVTLTGVGGVGKSTLASQVAECNRSSYPDGVWCADLAPLNDFALIAHTVADAMDLHDQSGRSMTTVLADHFQSQVALLVLDNCEHLVPACGLFIDALLHAAPDLRVLVTSKVPLHIEAEQVHDVKPLSVPEPDDADAPAVTLFVRRAAAGGFALTEDNRKEVISLCCRLEGVPLALELAAAQVRLLPLAELVGQLDNLIRMKPAIQATVDWSYELCSAAERLLWRRMSVFEGSFDLAAVENVCASYNDIPLDTVLDVIDGLVVKAVLTRLPEPGPVRYRVQETLRQYGREQLHQSGELPLVRRRHRNWYLNVAEHREQRWFGAAQQELSAQSGLDHANFRAALGFCLTEPGESAAGLRLAGALWFHWVGGGRLAEGQHWLDWALSATRQPTIDRWKALWVNGYVTALQGKTDAARQLLTQVGKDADDTSLAHTAYVMGAVSIFEEDLPTGLALLEQALARHGELRELDSNVIMTSVTLALALTLRGDLARAQSLCCEARELCEANEEKWALGYVLLALAVIAVHRGELAAATALTRESLRIKQSGQDLLCVAAGVGLLAVTANEDERAATLLGATRRVREHVGLADGSVIGHRRTEQAIQALGGTAYEAAFGRGARMSITDAITYALG
ncbi:ATP-binding protein [Kibdelosporangium phytohabitans]|uniref:Bacterial transcriptional activator domain-containing protein n=1 Tax=Kibdelosporangium phytohabitans TaxID=860235 RepID=A0A0N9IDS6_9PSEU|nr:BTAD domain-containing putative transcriptional regulator [Kibdelosporangium phytohabitans]ALG13238.1 hypothetical protein AOZ06_45965 [Kibdelosporangium phytohabitans]MBE1465006.1 non-specific serine/threonine protein kinase [Kibdelosporangium phytohabitans]